MSERRYRMTRLSAGDYLLPSNDGRDLWRIHTYTEDGSAFYTDDEGREVPIKGTYWTASRLAADRYLERDSDGRITAFDADAVDDGDAWDWTCAGTFTKRREAVDAAIGD